MVFPDKGVRFIAINDDVDSGRRSQGEFLGAFASYGYRKSAEDRHKLVIDDFAAEIVRRIFSMKMQGYGQQAIADSLNRMGVLPPSEYKKQMGLRYQSGFKSVSGSGWTAMAVRNILTNTIYIGERAKVLFKPAVFHAAGGRVCGLVSDFIDNTRVRPTTGGPAARRLKKRNLRFFKCVDYMEQPRPLKPRGRPRGARLF